MRLGKIVCLLLLLPSFGWAQLYVAVTGSDDNNGTKEKPFASVAMALRKARDMRRVNDTAVKSGIHIFIGNGIYYLEEPLFVRPEDAGTSESPTTIEAMPNTHPVFSGGMVVNGWRKAPANVPQLSKKAAANVWVADAPIVGGDVLNFRQLWVNDVKAVRAKDGNGDTMNRILSWNKKDESCWIPKPAVDVSKIEGMEMFIHQWWAIAVLRIKSVALKGDSALLRFQQPESRIQSEHPWPSPWISPETGNSAFYLANALPFLDSPGEWYLDRKARKLYYWPREGEHMNQATVVAPVLENLVRVEGTVEHPVSNIVFKGISFRHTTWIRPSEQGHVPLQTGMYLLDAYKLRPPGTPEKASLENQAWVGRPGAAVQVSYAKDITFETCSFAHLASTGLDLHRGVINSTVNGNLFKDVGGTAVLAGVFSDETTEAHLPYDPSDKREVCSDLVISNNLITGAAAEDWGCVGIGAGFVKATRIEHNDISDVNYTGISLGWGWTKAPNAMRNNRILANKIQRYGKQLYDVAAIYTLSAQPGTVISENYIDSIYKAPYAHIPSHWFYLYTDEGSSGITVKNNWTPSQKFLRNANGPDNVWANNGPTVSEAVKSAAGLQTAYQSLLKKREPYHGTQPINAERPVVIEIVAEGKEPVNAEKLKTVLAENGINSSTTYQWQNHTVIFEKVADVSVLKNRLQKAFPAAQTKIYYDAFYAFNRRYCGDTATAKDWDHILLTANLVPDQKLQQEYMAYHATQFERWPEVAKGFCNASFQQLLVYRNGRQLMLVISLPKGESLDRLNPKTTEGNPRVEEWNKRMAKYQEGIEGTKPGETWVFLKKVEMPN